MLRFGKDNLSMVKLKKISLKRWTAFSLSFSLLFMLIPVLHYGAEKNQNININQYSFFETIFPLVFSVNNIVKLNSDSTEPDPTKSKKNKEDKEDKEDEYENNGNRTSKKKANTKD